MRAILILIFFVINIVAHGQEMFLERQYISDNGKLPYRILVPENLNSGQTYPLVIFLHGAGERGTDNKSQLIHGSSLFSSDSVRKKFPSIVVFPQCPKDSYWSNVEVLQSTDGRKFNFNAGGKPTIAMQLLLEMIDSLMVLPQVDKSKVYIGGLSMGGMGTFELVYRRPELFAAAFPICGGGSTGMAEKYNKNISFWIFHGAKDDIIPPVHSKDMAEAILYAGLEVKLSIYPNANHNSWDKAFNEPGFLKWLFSKSLNK